MFGNFEKYKLRINNDNYLFINSLDFNEYYKEIYNFSYDSLDYTNRRKTFLGSEKKCCFCGESDPAKLTDEIHVIPASFGNRWLFSIEECNECNNKFGISFEQNLSEMFAANRIFSTIPKRKGFSKIQVPNTKSSIKPEKKGEIKIQTYEGEDNFKIDHLPDNCAVITIPSAPYYPLKAIKSIIHSLWLVLDKDKRDRNKKILDWLYDKVEILPFYYTVGFIPGVGVPFVGFTVWEKIQDDSGLTNLIVRFSLGSTFIFLEIPDFESKVYLPGILPQINLSLFPPYEPSIKVYKIKDNSQYRPKTSNFTISYERLVKIEIDSETQADDIAFSKIPISSDNNNSSFDYNYPLPISLEIKKDIDSVLIDHTYLNFKKYDIHENDKSLNSYEIIIEGGMLSGNLKIDNTDKKINFNFNINFEDSDISFVKNTIKFFKFLATGDNLIIKAFDPSLEELNLEIKTFNITNDTEKMKFELSYYYDLFENIELINTEFNHKIVFSKDLTSDEKDDINILGDCIKYGSCFYKTSEFEIPIPKNTYDLIIEQLKNSHDNFLIRSPDHAFKIGEFNIKIDEIYIQVLNPELIFENEEVKILHEDNNYKYIKVKTDCIIFMIYKKAIENIESDNSNQNSFEALFSLASIYSARNNFNDALNIFHKLLQINSQYKNLNYNIAITYSEINDLENTIKYLKEEINNYPSDSDSSYIALTKFYTSYTSYNSEILSFFEEIASKYNALDAYKSLATIYNKESKKDDLLRVLLEENKIIPKEKELNLIIATLYYEKKDYKKAIEFYKKEIVCNDKSDISFYNLACSYSLIGNIEDSLKALEKSISLDSKYIEMAKNDKDFESIKTDPHFINLLNT